MKIEQVQAIIDAYDYQDLFHNKLWVQKEWTLEQLCKLKLPFYSHLGEYIQLCDAIQFWNENCTLEERNARLFKYLSIQSGRFQMRVHLGHSRILVYETFMHLYAKSQGTKWALQEQAAIKALTELYPKYSLFLDFKDVARLTTKA